MIIFPSFFINILMYVIASILIISGILQVINIRDAKLWHDMPIKIYVIPLVIIMVGIIVILNPMITVSLSLIVLGVISILYSIFEIIYSIKIKKLKDKYES